MTINRLVKRRRLNRRKAQCHAERRDDGRTAATRLLDRRAEHNLRHGLKTKGDKQDSNPAARKPSRQVISVTRGVRSAARRGPRGVPGAGDRPHQPNAGCRCRTTQSVRTFNQKLIRQVGRSERLGGEARPRSGLCEEHWAAHPQAPPPPPLSAAPPPSHGTDRRDRR